jgi:hypothetical protein
MDLTFIRHKAPKSVRLRYRIPRVREMSDFLSDASMHPLEIGGLVRATAFMLIIYIILSDDIIIF